MSMLISTLLAALTGGGALALDPIESRAGKFYDSKGNERNFRGVNVVYKDFPWLPDTVDKFDANLSFVQDDIDLLKSLGNNLIRLGVMWPGSHPEENSPPDEVYLSRVDAMIQLLADNDMYVLVEPHQDEMNPLFCGEGAPDWWVEKFTAGVSDFPNPVQDAPFDASPPTHATCDTHSSFSYIWSNDAAAAYQNLWETGSTNGFGTYWKDIASRYQNFDNVIGGEIWNEPFLGDVFSNPYLRDNKVSDEQNLSPFYENITAIVRNAGVEQKKFALFFEPTWPVGNQDLEPDAILTATSGFEQLPELDSVYAFHYYVAPCNPDIDQYMDERLADALRLGATPFVSEFNLAAWDEESYVAMVAVFNSIENRQISYTGWQYKSFSGSLPDGTCTGCGNSFFNDDGSSNLYLQRSMGRVFAPVVAGVTVQVTNKEMKSYEIEFVPSLNGQLSVFVVPEWWAGGLGQDNFMVTVNGTVGGYDSKIDTNEVVFGRKVAEGVEIGGMTEVSERSERVLS